ncbi:Eco57I restriction-modification methylase domain-containing protein [Caulobacter henricii]|uniref:Eco57I restriction-modification methylase domain-containing protein n=1 Tax=Caulobacter henricii TaxID=69395 RepID=UPI000A4B744E|nr:N-6 DNA methylase [Caulobacter henricii]
MARKPISDMSAWPSLRLEGNLIAPAMIAQIDQRKAPEQTEEDYAVRKGLTIREEISTAFRVGQSHFDAFNKIESPSQDATRRFMTGFLRETFGYQDLTPAAAPLALIASSRVPVVVVPPSETLDRRSPTLSIDRSRSPAFALQDYLNDTDEALWGIVTNGAQMRLMRDNASLTRPAFIEADLAQIFSTEDIASFAALWLLIHRSRFGVADAPATDCPLERWREAGSREGEVARDRLAGQVQIALKVLGSGFLEANPDLSEKLKSGEVNLTAWFNELLRLVYRLIFLMVAEDRNLLHPAKAKSDARALYAEGYSLSALRKQCYRAATWDKHHDRYEGIKIVFRALAHGQEALALPALGGLFTEDRLPHLETARLRNRAFMEALYRLSWLADKTGMVPVNWRAMETEELGSVYESLLELQPQLGDDGRTLIFASEAAEQKGNQRKTTGSYYTPDSLVQALLDTALDPVLDKTEAEADDPAKALLKLSVIDPACGSGHFLLAAARRIATRLARIRAEGTPSLADFRHALRDVARCCIHGVDRNPMAVELTKVALWIETVDPGLPLGFFDAQIRCGDALLGVFDLKVLQDGIPDAAYKPLTGDDRDIASIYKRVNAAARQGQGGFDFGAGVNKLPETRPLALDFSGFRDLPEDTVEQIGAKAARFEALREDQTYVRAAIGCDLYVAAFLLPKIGHAPTGPSVRTIPTTEELWLALNQGKIRPSMLDAPKAAHRARAFHWPLEFPDVIQRGGFDVVVGNPPYGAAPSSRSSIRNFFSVSFEDDVDGSNICNYFLAQAIRFGNVGAALGFILPKSISYVASYEKTRGLITARGDLTLLADCGAAFKDVGLEQILLTFCLKAGSSPHTLVGYFDGQVFQSLDKRHSNVWRDRGYWEIHLTPKRMKIASAIEQQGIPLSQLCIPNGGIFRGLGLQSKRNLHADAVDDAAMPVLGGKNITSYVVWDETDEPFIYANSRHPELLADNAFTRQLSRRIALKNISSSVIKIEATLLDQECITLDTINSVVLSDCCAYPYEYVLAFMNSRVANWYMKWVVFNRSVLTMHFDADYIGRLPIPIFVGAQWQTEIANLASKLLSVPARKFRKGVTNLEEVHGELVQRIDQIIAQNISVSLDTLD